MATKSTQIGRLGRVHSGLFPGVQDKTGRFVVDIDKARLMRGCNDYFDATITNSEMAEKHQGFDGWLDRL